ncbi:Formyltetrahydrofolate deformylase [Pseudoclavibacter triregionum]|nr:Formyltetrahydrofolate deformylase [Pseudoclavibacter triregionum]
MTELLDQPHPDASAARAAHPAPRIPTERIPLDRTDVRWILTLVCRDQPGIVNALTGAIVEVAGNILELQQFSSTDTDRFFMRVEFRTEAERERIESALAPVAARLGAEIQLELGSRPTRALILGTKAAHCVNDLLFRQRSGHLNLEVPRLMANHAVLGDLAAFYGVPFEHRPIDSPADKDAFERRVLEIIDEERIDLVILARYMRILSPELCEALAGRAINIHHSFLPGFKGANPYRQAHARGVKLIGATAHFVTSDLDEGPIIEQNVVRVDHTRTPQQLMAIGEDEESRTLTQAVKWFSEHRVLLDGSRTIIFR